LAAMGGGEGRHGALSPGNRGRASVVGRFDRGSVGFSRDALEPRLGQVDTVHSDAGRGWQRVDVTTLCSPACSARLGEGGVHGNDSGALGALAARWTPVWHGRGGTHGGLRAGLAWGIDPWAWCDAGGEVTGQELVGGAQARLGAHGGHGDGAGGVGCWRSPSAGWGWG
jgi:hypothetical protein